MARVEREAGHTQEEVADLQKVVEQYPQSRDARRELGVTYYHLQKTEEAMAQFEALQAIDPDDTTAHYNLALLYSRLGMTDKAAQQAKLFATKKVDPNAPTYSLDFLRKHPEISTESVPWHLHTDVPPDSLSDLRPR
jgi:tetratricopeptide (TPR) repeat protein